MSQNVHTSKNSNKSLLQNLKSTECWDATFHDQSPAIVLDKAKGSTVWDSEGSSYIDMCAGFGALPLGHNDPDIFKKLSEDFLSERPSIIHGLGDVHPSKDKIDLLDKLFRVLPRHLEKGALSVTGGQAVEIAMKSAMLHTNGDGFIAFKGGYHGLDLGSLALNDREDFRGPFNHWINSKKVTHLDFGCPKQMIDDAIDHQLKNKIKTAAIIVEPIQGRAGIKSAPKDWLNLLRKTCTERGILLIFDEVFTGLGRSGRMSFAEETPCDLLCLGKALGGGMPLSVCVGTKQVMESWPKSKGEAIHTGTFFGHPLSCKVGLLTLERIVSENLIKRSKDFGPKYRSLLESVLRPHMSLIKEIRGEGMMTAIEFYKKGTGAILMEKLREFGMIAIPSGEFGECLSLTPALNISKEELEISASLIATVCGHL